MKNWFCQVFLIALLLFAFVSCKKELASFRDDSLKFDSVFHVASDNRMLIFETTNYYEDIISSPDAQLREEFISYIEQFGFESYAERFPENDSSSLFFSSNDSTCDSFLAEILNADGIVQIGEYLYKIDFSNGVVGVLHSDYLSDYPDLVELDSLNPNVRRFTTGDDVIDLAESGAPSTARVDGCGGIGGGTYKSYQSLGLQVVTFPDGSVWRLYPAVKFFRAGVYFRLSSFYEVWAHANATTTTFGAKVKNLSQLFKINFYCKGPEGWYQKRNCGNNDIGTQSSGFYYSRTIASDYTSFYCGTRNLNGYHFFIRAEAQYPNGSVSSLTPYAGRNINSPY